MGTPALPRLDFVLCLPSCQEGVATPAWALQLSSELCTGKCTKTIFITFPHHSSLYAQIFTVRFVGFLLLTASALKTKQSKPATTTKLLCTLQSMKLGMRVVCVETSGGECLPVVTVEWYNEKEYISTLWVILNISPSQASPFHYWVWACSIHMRV